MYLGVELKISKDNKHKLAPVVEGPFKVINTDTQAAIIENVNQSVGTL